MRATWLERIDRWAAARHKRLTDWHRSFAWRPTWVAEGDCRWLEWIERKCKFVSGHDGTYCFCEYRPPNHMREQ